MMTEITVTRYHGSSACGEQFHVYSGVENDEGLAVGREP